jgi:hypothetical protein
MFNTPTVLTKELKIQCLPSTGQRRIRLSTNFLRNFGFNPGIRLHAVNSGIMQPNLSKNSSRRQFSLKMFPATTDPMLKPFSVQYCGAAVTTFNPQF